MQQENQPTVGNPSTSQNPQVMQQSTESNIQTSQPQPNQIPDVYKPAGFRLRYLAYFIDGLVFGLAVIGPLVILFSLIKLTAGNSLFFISNTVGNILYSASIFLLYVIYLVYFTYRSGATPGKRYVGIKVISIPEGLFSLKKVIIREVSKQLISVALSLFGNLLIVIAFYFLIIRNIYGVLGILGGNGKGFFQHSSGTLILTAVLIVLVYFLVSIFVYYKVFFSLKAGKRGIQDWLAGTRVIVVKPMSRAKKIWLGVLIFLIVLMPILGIFAAITLIAINPARQFAQANNTQRSSNVQTIANAISQYRNDNNGAVPPGIEAIARTITDSGAPGTVDLCTALVPRYLTDIEIDSVIGIDNPKGSVCTDLGADYNSGYTVMFDPISNLVRVSAPGAEVGQIISATESSYGVDQTNSTSNFIKDDNVRQDIGVISTALWNYYAAKNTFPVSTDDLTVNENFVARSAINRLTYMTVPAGCAGIEGNPCVSVAVYSQLSSPLIAGNVWCWRSADSHLRAKEVSVSECIP